MRVTASALGPLLVARAVTGPEDQQGAVGGSGAVRAQAQAGLHAGDRAVGVQVPLLVGPAIAVPDEHPGARPPCRRPRGPGTWSRTPATASTRSTSTAGWSRRCSPTTRPGFRCS